MNAWFNTRKSIYRPSRTYSFGSACMTGFYGKFSTRKNMNPLKLGYYYSRSYMRGIYGVTQLRDLIKRTYDKAGLGSYKPSNSAIERRIRDGFKRNWSITQISSSFTSDMLKAA
jgi:hypothetical protein